MPLKNCHTMFLLQRSTSSSSLRLKEFFRYCKLAINRTDRRGRPAGLMPLPNSISCSPRKSCVTRLAPGRAWRAKFNRGPRQAFAQNHQWMFVFNHPVQAGTKEVCGIGHSNPPEKIPSDNDSSEILPSEFTPYLQHSCGLARFCRADYLHIERFDS
jgi:hypothetical protein